ncbi:hypothetical protein BP5796_02615 [Coleophoma crateriformis]|uniref:Uncharacterized protein n=1 Tax=Coleophoma crateriformis TaxID=565419 RepID=A0A3D8SYU0_9HELO|nr:hypothetical protein BP5796_02615 [Coleophoma crateriformis]
MGVESRRAAPPLPAPTETDSTIGHNTSPTELDSKVTEKTTYSLPEDGTPVTISTRRKKHDKDGKGGLTSNKSQTSLLIEYFEGGKGSHAESRRPSVRVKVTPSSKSRSRSANDHIQITETKGARKPSYTKRIQLSPNAKAEGEGDDKSLSSYASATEESNLSQRPIEVEIMPRRHGSPLIPTGESSRYVPVNASDISSMPADSFLDGKSGSPERTRSRSLTRGEVLAAGAATGLVAGEIADKLRTPSRRRSRSLSRERIVVQKAVEKVRGDKSEHRRKRRERSRSVSNSELAEGIKSPRRRSSRSHHEESMITGGESSLLSNQSRKSGDAYSFRSGTSKSSINNPKLLETVEDAIRRLILPELTALKREQSKHTSREKDRRGSITSASGISRDSRDESVISGKRSTTDLSGRPSVAVNDEEVITSTPRRRRERKSDRAVLDGSPRSFERGESEDTVVQDDKVHKKRTSDKHRGLEAAAIGAGIGALTAAALKSDSKDPMDEKKERRRRRTKSRSRSDIESFEEHEKQEIVPPMPLMSDINASEITRSSILSAETDRPLSASDEHRVTPVWEVPRGIASPSQRTPTRTPVALQQGLGTQHSNFSRGNLSLHSQDSEHHLHSQEYELDEHGRKVPMHGSSLRQEEQYEEDEDDISHSNALGAGLMGAAAGGGLAALRNRPYDEEEIEENDHHDPELEQSRGHYEYYQNHQEVPPPLKYVPYGYERRGLSPIQSVSGYTEDDYDHQKQRNSRLTQSTGSYSSLNKSAHHKDSARSMRSMDSTGNVHHNNHDFPNVRTGGLTDSELTQQTDGEYWEEQHRENDRARDLDGTDSYRSYDGPRDQKHMSNYTNDSMVSGELDQSTAGRNIRDVGANPDYVHTPIAVESAVASLVNPSELTGSGFSANGQYDRRGSYASFEDGSEEQFTSRGNSPTKQAIRKHPSYNPDDNGMLSQFESRENSPTKEHAEYGLDEHGRKVPIPEYEKSHTAEKAGLAGMAAGAAAVLLGHRKHKSSADEIQYEDRLETTGAPLQKSFKDRASEGPIPSPKHSIDALSEAASHQRYQMGASGIPDEHDPMPEIGYGDGESEVTTNPSIIQGPIGGSQQDREHWSGHTTPPRTRMPLSGSPAQHSEGGMKAAEAALLGAAAGAGTAAAISSHNKELGHEHELEEQDDEWQRTSAERKRDTLVTNPWEGTSPVAALPDGLDHEMLAQGGYQGINHDFGSKMGYHQAGSPVNMTKDEGYISSAPNARSPGALTPEPRAKGVGFLDQELGGGQETTGDPFYTPKHNRHLSGMSHGMGSPLYDSATGNGIDRIQSRDIVALMDHLTVRDAQRSARDTEILVTLVRAAAEMRNSFEDMKRLLADTEDVIITEVQQNTDRSIQKAINGPRPQPPSVPRSLRQGSQDEMHEDIPTKRRNVFRRALKGLSMKSSNDLGKIEEMLVQLLGEVEGLKVAQGLKPHSSAGATYDDLHLQQEGNYENDRGYEPEGHSTTASHASQSGPLSIPKSRGTSAARQQDARKFSDYRISTVPEGDEEDLDARREEIDPHEQAVLNNQFENNEQLLTPTREDFRSGSAPLGTPPQHYVEPASLSNENTPRTGTDKSKKHKSSSSSGWIPKVSRWSETTASTVLRGFRSSGRNSGRKENDQYAEPPSRSGSDLGNYEDHHNPYGDDKLHSGFSEDQLRPFDDDEPDSLLPPEDPKYKAHRNSLNLQHPQPRPGQHYQTNLESQAQNYANAPLSPKSVDWGSSTSINRLPAPQTNRYSNTTTSAGGNLSPISDGGYSNGSARGPARPPKEPIVPEIPPKLRPNKLQKPSPLSNEHLAPETAYENGSPAAKFSTGVPARKPTGPRSMGSASKSGELNRDDGTVIRRNKNRDTFGTIASNHSGESETF